MASKKSIIKIDIYEATLHLVIADDVQKAKNNLIKKKLIVLDDPEEAAAWFIYDDPDERIYWIIMPTDATPGLIAHEVSHLTTKLLATCGVSSTENDEPYAYLIGFLVDKIWDKLTVVRKKKDLEGKDDTKGIQERVVLQVAGVDKPNPTT